MKKIIFLFLIVFCFGYIAQKTLAQYNYDIINYELNTCIKKDEPQCHYNLVSKYNDIPALKYYYGISLINNKRYQEAREQLKKVINNSSSPADLKAKANNQLKVINQKINEINSANNNDAGDYYNELTTHIKWSRPYDLKVYIYGNTGKEYILKKAFNIWDSSLYQTVNFTYTTVKEKADITCAYVDSLEGNSIGKTYFQYTSGPSKYMQKADVYVSMHNPTGGKYTDEDLLSIALHEVGHAIGINGHSKNRGDAMYYSTESVRHGTISRRDINTVEKIY